VWVFSAPPGWGKTRALVALGRRRRLAIFVRSHAEALQTAWYALVEGLRPGVLLGRERLCPLHVRDLAECVEARESGRCRARWRRLPKLPNPGDLVVEAYRLGACPYEALHGSALSDADVFVAPMAYLFTRGGISAIRGVLNDVDLVAIDEAHNLYMDVRSDFGDGVLCVGDRCLGLVALKALEPRDVVLVSASLTRRFLEPLEALGEVRYVEVPWFDDLGNLLVDVYRLRIRFWNREEGRVISVVSRIVAAYPGRRLVVAQSSEYAKSLGEALGEAATVTYFGSPITEGVNVDFDAVILVGFPWPDPGDASTRVRAAIYRRFLGRARKYAYLFPAISMSVQALGRATRGLGRRIKYGVLIDDRYARYMPYMPTWVRRLATPRAVPSDAV